MQLLLGRGTLENMMAEQLLLVAGLPGCGKTGYLRRLETEGWRIFDDFKANARQDSSHFAASRHYDSLIQDLRDGRRCVVADIDFCRESARAEAEHVLRRALPDVVFAWQFFENHPERCAFNIRRRNRHSIEADLRKLEEFASVYSVPEGVETMPIGG